MKLLLCSSGISNSSIEDALVELLGKPIGESSALCIPTGVQPFPGGPSHVYQFISGATLKPMCGLGWKSLGVLELTALPSIKKDYWISAVQETDALLVWGGSPPICVSGCGNRGWPTSCPRFAPKWSTWPRAAGRWWRQRTSEERPMTRVNRSPAATTLWRWSISRCSHTSTARTAFRPALRKR